MKFRLFDTHVTCYLIRGGLGIGISQYETFRCSSISKFRMNDHTRINITATSSTKRNKFAGISEVVNISPTTQTIVGVIVMHVAPTAF